MMRSHLLSVISNGFSTITCLPARAAATAGSMCAPLGVAIVGGLIILVVGIGMYRLVDRVTKS